MGPELSSKLDVAVSSSTVVGTVSDYMVERYGFLPDCVVGAFTGDNIAFLYPDMRTAIVGRSVLYHPTV